MDITVRPLSQERAADFFDFFDHRAFTDDSPEGPCYCTRFQMTKEEEHAAFANIESGPEAFIRTLRQLAAGQIASGALRGYLAFVDGVAVGWCNVNDRANFPEESGNGARLYAPAEKREKVVLCFLIAPEFRRKGVATALLQRAVADAQAEGYASIEGFPPMRGEGERYEWEFRGPVSMYEKAGFVKVGEYSKGAIMRKELR